MLFVKKPVPQEIRRFELHDVGTHRRGFRDLPDGVQIRFQGEGDAGSFEVYNALHDSWIKLKVGDWLNVQDLEDVYPIEASYFAEHYEPHLPELELRQIGRPRPLLHRIPGVGPPKVVQMAEERREYFRRRMMARGVSEDQVDKVLEGLVELGDELIGASRWWNRGRAAVGLIGDIIDLLRR